MMKDVSSSLLTRPMLQSVSRRPCFGWIDEELSLAVQFIPCMAFSCTQIFECFLIVTWLLKLYSQSRLIINFILCDEPWGVMLTDQGPVLFCIWFESSPPRRHCSASAVTYREISLLLLSVIFPCVRPQYFSLKSADLYD